MSTEYEVITIIEERLNVRNVSMSDHIKDDLGADSLDVVDLIMCYEDKFDVEIIDEAVESLYTVQEMVDYIENKR